MVYDDTFTAEFYEKLMHSRMNFKMRTASGMAGSRKSNAKGASVEFSDFREYIPGDDIRRIDWNAYGRFEKLFVKLFMEEKEGIFRIYLDTSSSMDFGEEPKIRHAKRMAALYGYNVLRNQDRVILNVMSGNRTVNSLNVSGRQGFSKLVDTLAAAQCNGGTDILGAIKTSDIRSRGVSIIISDFYTNDLEDILRFLTAKKQEIILVQVLTEWEKNPDMSGSLSLLDTETGEHMRITASGALFKAYKKQFVSFQEETERLAKKYSARLVSITDGK